MKIFEFYCSHLITPKKILKMLNEFHYEKDGTIHIEEIFHFLIFMLNGFMNILITVIQVIYAERSQNFTYFVGCSMFGPFHIIAVLLALSISY